MKKLWCIVFAVILLCGVFVLTAEAEQPIKLYMDGELVEADVSPCIINGRLMMPVRTMAELFGCEILWDGNGRTAHIISFKIPESHIYEWNEGDPMPEMAGDVSSYVEPEPAVEVESEEPTYIALERGLRANMEELHRYWNIEISAKEGTNTFDFIEGINRGGTVPCIYWELINPEGDVLEFETYKNPDPSFGNTDRWHSELAYAKLNGDHFGYLDVDYRGPGSNVPNGKLYLWVTQLRELGFIEFTEV